MTRLPRLPVLARWLVRLAPVPRAERDAICADLLELFTERRADVSRLHAYGRLCHDIASLWHRPPPVFSAGRPRLGFLRDARADLKYGARLFARQPAILLLTIAGLSLGLGIATSAFSIMNAAALRGEGLVDPDRVPGVLRIAARSTSTSWKYGEFVRLREGAALMRVEGLVTDVAAVRTQRAEGLSTSMAFVSGGFFSAVGARMAQGRELSDGDAQPADTIPVVVSHHFWGARLNRDPNAVGRAIQIGRATGTIVGIAEARFVLPGNRLMWLPLTAYGAVYDGAPRAPDTGIQVFGRLLPRATLNDAQAQLSAVAAGLDPDAGPLQARLDTHAGLGRASASDILMTAIVVFGVIGLVLLLGAANAATVLIATAITREREMAMRAALGASRARLMRQLVTESLALGAIAAAVGLLLAYWTIPIAARMIDAPAGVDLSPDLRVFLFLGIATLVSGVGAGLAPARHGRGADLVAPLKGDARHNRAAPRRLRSTLIAAQAAASVLLLVLAALFVRATFQAARVDVGFDASRVYTVTEGSGDVFNDAGTRVEEFRARALPVLRDAPGVEAVTVAETTPFSGITRSSITREDPARVVYLTGTDAAYFETVGLGVLAGRAYTPDEVAAAAPVAVVSESLARAYWPAGSPLGELLPPQIPVASRRPVIIGVVGDAITARLDQGTTLAVYEPIDPAHLGFAELMIRVAPGGTDAVDHALRRLRALDPHAEVRAAAVGARLEQQASRPRMLATLAGIVGLVAVVLCVIGLYGLTASLVGQRAREMAVRAAIGAAPRDLLRLLMWDSLRPAVFGLAAGAGLAWSAGRLLASAVFFGVPPGDPIAVAGAAAILICAAALAVLVPTRRAAKVDATLALKQS